MPVANKFAFIFIFAVSTAALAQTGPESGFVTLSVSESQAIDNLFSEVQVEEIIEAPDYSVQKLDDSQFDTNDGKKIAMQIGLGGNPDVDKGKPFRDDAGVISILYPVKTTDIAGAPVTIYLEARCHALGKQPVSAETNNRNIRCGPGVLADTKLLDWLSGYVRLGSVTSRFSHNGAPVGQINPKTGVQFRDYPNNTWFTGVGMGAGLKIKVQEDTALFAEYTKYYVQQTDNPAYQFRGGYTFGFAKEFWLFTGGK